MFSLFVAGLMLVLYLTVKGLPSAAVRKIEPYLQFSGMVLTLEKIKLSIFEGIVATGVKYYKKGDIGEAVVQADRVVLKLEPLAWIRGESGVSGAIVKNGRAQFALGAEPADKLKLDKIYADVSFDHQERLRVKSFAAALPGLNVSGQGTIIIPAEKTAALQTHPAAAAGAKAAAPDVNPTLKTIPAWLKLFAGSNALNLNVDFLADPDRPERLAVKANLHGRKTVIGASTINALSANLAVNGKIIEGTFALTEADLETVPLPALNGALKFDEKGLLKVSLKSTVGRAFKAGPLELTLNYDSVSNTFAGHATAGCDPRSFVALLRNQRLKLADIFSDLDFKRSPPASEIYFNGELKPAFHCRLRGTVLADTFSYKQVPSLLLKIGFDVFLDEQGEKVVIQPLLIVRDEGMVRGGFVYDSAGQIITFSGMAMTDPKATLTMIDPELAAVLAPYTFQGLCQVTAAGTVGCTNSAPNNIEVNLNASDVRWKMFDFSTCALNLYILERNYRIDDLKGSIYNGGLNGSATIDPIVGSTNMHFAFSATADNVDFGKLVKSLAGKQLNGDYQGACSAAVNLEGFCEDAARASYQGDGWLKIEHGHIFTVPIFSGLFDIIGKVVPGLGKLADKNNAHATFTIGSGKVHSSNMLIEGNVFNLRGSGDIYFDGRLDYKVQLSFLSRSNLLGNLVHLVTMPLTKALELHLGGMVDDPQWNATYLPF